jgi:hypothetical protein
MIADRKGKTRNYVLREDRGLQPEQQTTFILRGLGHRERARLFDLLEVDFGAAGGKAGTGGTGGTGRSRGIGSFSLEACRIGLAGWKNLRAPDGGEVAFRGVQVAGVGICPTEEDLAEISSAIDELGGAVLNLNGLGDDEEAGTDSGNSSSSPTSASAAPGSTSARG